MIQHIAYRMLSKALVRGAVCMTCVMSYEAVPIVDLRGTLPTAGEYPIRDLSRINATVVHHSASKGQTIRNLAEYHIAARGWQGIAYHYGIGWDGTIYQMNAVERRTNHAQGHNTRSIGVVLVGNYDLIRPSPEMVHSAAYLCRYLSEQYHADTVLWHSETKVTACPGRYARAELQHLKGQ